MTVCNPNPLLFPSFEGRKVEGSFEGGEVGSDGSVQFLRLAQMAGEWTARAEAQYTATKEKQRLFAELHYAAASWDKLRPSAERSGASS